MSNDDIMLITPDEAESLLCAGDQIHNYVNPAPSMFIGCDYERADAIAAFKAAKQIEIAGPHCKSVRHPIAVLHADGRRSFFEADMDKIAAFESAKATGQ